MIIAADGNLNVSTVDSLMFPHCKAAAVIDSITGLNLISFEWL